MRCRASTALGWCTSSYCSVSAISCKMVLEMRVVESRTFLETAFSRIFSKGALEGKEWKTRRSPSFQVSCVSANVAKGSFPISGLSEEMMRAVLLPCGT